MISMNWIFQVSWVKSCIIKRANRVSSQSKESQSARKQASKCFLGDETRRKSRRKRRGEGWSTSVRPYLRPDDRCRGPSLDKLSFVPSLPPRCQSVYSTALSVCLYSILVPPPLSISVARARASSFGTGFEWTANTRAPNGGGGGEASNRAETERKTKKNRPDLRCQLFQPRSRRFQRFSREIKISESVRNGFWEKNIYLYVYIEDDVKNWERSVQEKVVDISLTLYEITRKQKEEKGMDAWKIENRRSFW